MANIWQTLAASKAKQPATPMQPMQPATAKQAAPQTMQQAPDSGMEGPPKIPSIPSIKPLSPPTSPSIATAPQAPMLPPPPSINTAPSPAPMPAAAPLTPPQAPNDAQPSNPMPSPMPTSSAPAGLNATLSPYGPGNDLRGTQVTPTSVDRFDLMSQRLNQFNDEQEVVAEKERRDLLKNGAAMGRLGSGMLRTDFGNLSDKLDLNRRGVQTRLLTDAVEGTIQDGRSDRDELRTERGFQQGMQQQIKDDAIQQWLMEQQKEGRDFSEGMGLAGLGYTGNPSGAIQAGANAYGAQASGAFDPLMYLLMNRGG